MNSFMMAFSVVVPLLVYMAVGIWIRRSGMMSLANFKGINVVIFKVFIPLTLFFNIYNADIINAIDLRVVILAEGGILTVYFLGLLILPRFISSGPDEATFLQGIYRSNFVLYGMTVASSLCDNEGIALISALSAVVVPTFNMLAVILFETKAGNAVNVKEIIINIFKNPLVDAGLIGIVFSLLKLPLPDLLAAPLKTMGNIATPLALVVLGGLLSFESMKSHKRLLAVAALLRLVVIPLIVISIALLWGLRGGAVIALLTIFASPTAVASAPMAQSMGGNGELAGEIVAVTTVMSLFTIFLFVFFLSLFQFI